MKRPKEITAEAWLRRCVQTADSVNVENKTAYLGTLAILGSLVYAETLDGFARTLTENSD